MSERKCRFCGEKLTQTFVDLGMMPIANDYVPPAKLNHMEPYYPLHTFFCTHCYLVQLDQYESPKHIFSDDYAYFSSYSDSWLEHARKYTDMIIDKEKLMKSSRVIEIASNDGYLLQYFKEKEIPVLGVEPAANVAMVARKKGIPMKVAFFGEKLAKEMMAENIGADLLIANNVLAHVPDLHDFVAGLKILLKPHGTLTVEFPHLMQLVKHKQFDTIYHEHFSYFSFTFANKMFASYDLTIFHVEQLETHGGSLRLYIKHRDYSPSPSREVYNLLGVEKEAGIESPRFYMQFTEKVKQIKFDVLDFFVQLKKKGKVIVGYGAPAKGNTFLNYCGIDRDFIDYTVDRNIHKQGFYLPGTHIPIESPQKLLETKPDYVLILPWNLTEEVLGQLKMVREWGGKFITAIPEVKVM